MGALGCRGRGLAVRSRWRCCDGHDLADGEFDGPAYISSPSAGVLHLGPLPIRAYALCITADILLAHALTRRRWVARGGTGEQVETVAMWVVPFGIIGGRLYRVITDPELYFKRGEQPIRRC